LNCFVHNSFRMLLIRRAYRVKRVLSTGRN
jgi:hypothetical protein